MHAVIPCENVLAMGRLFISQVQVVMSIDGEPPSRNLRFSVVLDAVGVRVVKHA